ncbi:MAG: TRAP transporter fused permease subunit [Bauldia litoralis]
MAEQQRGSQGSQASIPDAVEAGRLAALAASPLPLRVFVRAGAFLLTVIAIAWVFDALRLINMAVHTAQFLSVVLGISIPLVFLAVPARRGTKRTGVPWYDLLMAIASFATMAYVTVRYPHLLREVAYMPTDAIVIGAVILPILLEGLRRTVGATLVGIILTFSLVVLFGEHIPGKMQARPINLDELLVYLAIDTNAMLGRSLYIAASIVITFVLMGEILARSGGSRFFTEVSVALMGGYRGGSAKISVVASSLFGSISGSVVSNVASTGIITIPMMKSDGYAAHQAGAIEATASTGGQLMPPVMGAAAFLMAEYLQIDYSEVVLAALIPAILYYVALFIFIDLLAARLGIQAARHGKRNFLAILRHGWFFPLPFGVLIVALFWLNERPGIAAIYACLVLIPVGFLIGYRGLRMKLRDILDAFVSTGLVVLDLMMIGAAAGLIIGMLQVSGLGFGLILAFVQVGEGNIFLLLVMAAVICIVLGMGMPTVGVYVLLAALVAPALVEVGLSALGSHLFILYFGMMSMITPPICVAAFAGATIAGSDPMRTGWSAMKFGWTAYIIPFLFILSPSLLMQGETISIILAFVTAVGGVWLVSIGFVGHFAGSLSVLLRASFVVAGVALMVPVDLHPSAYWSDIFGFASGLTLVALCIIRNRGSVAPASEQRALK